MSRFRFKPWMALAGLLALLVIFFATTFFIADQEERAAAKQGNNAVTGAVGSLASPAVSGANGFASSVKEFVLRLFGARDVDKEYEQLKIRVQQLETANELMQHLERENERLTELLGFKEKYPEFYFIPARVCGRQASNWFFYFDLDKGSNQGVEMNMTVVNEDGLVGTIIEVNPDSCKVMAIIDRNSAVSVILESSRDQGMLHGSPDPQSADSDCEIYYIPDESEVVPGSKVVTSNFDGISLNGIPVGTIGEVGRGKGRVITLIPYVDFAHLENVLIIRAEKGTDPVNSGNTNTPGGSTPPDNGLPGGSTPPDNRQPGGSTPPEGEGQATAKPTDSTQQDEPAEGGEGN